MTCTTGTACNNLSAARATTIHSFAGVGLLKEQILERVRKRKNVLERIASCQLLFIDEVSILSRVSFEFVMFVVSRNAIIKHKL